MCSSGISLEYYCKLNFFFIDIMAVISNGSEGKAVLTSPWYNRSAEGFGKCLQFRYLMFGPGAEALDIYQELEMGPRQIWRDSNNTVPFWRYGQVSLTSVARHKVRAEHCKTVVSLFAGTEINNNLSAPD